MRRDAASRGHRHERATPLKGATSPAEGTTPPAEGDGEAGLAVATRGRQRRERDFPQRVSSLAVAPERQTLHRIKTAPTPSCLLDTDRTNMGKVSRRRRGGTRPGRTATDVDNMTDPPSAHDLLAFQAALQDVMMQQEDLQCAMRKQLIEAACPGASGINVHLLDSVFGVNHGAAAVAWEYPVIILDDAALRTPGTIFEFSSAVNNTPKLVAQLRSALAVDHTIRLDRTTAQRELECTAVSVTVSALTVSCGGSLPANVLGTCVAMGSRVAVEARDRNSVTGDLEILHVYPLVGRLGDRSYSLKPGNLFDNEDRLRLFKVLDEGFRNGRSVAICELSKSDPTLSRVFLLSYASFHRAATTISGHTFTLAASPGGFELIDSLPNQSLTGHEGSGFRLRTTSLGTLERALIANVASRLNLREGHSYTNGV